MCLTKKSYQYWRFQLNSVGQVTKPHRLLFFYAASPCSVFVLVRLMLDYLQNQNPSGNLNDSGKYHFMCRCKYFATALIGLLSDCLADYKIPVPIGKWNVSCQNPKRCIKKQPTMTYLKIKDESGHSKDQYTVEVMFDSRLSKRTRKHWSACRRAFKIGAFVGGGWINWQSAFALFAQKWMEWWC